MIGYELCAQSVDPFAVSINGVHVPLNSIGPYTQLTQIVIAQLTSTERQFMPVEDLVYWS